MSSKTRFYEYVLWSAVGVCGAAVAAHADIAFVDATGSAGIEETGPSWGAAWRDYDGDGLPDLWIVNHTRPASLYRNVDGSEFVDIGHDVAPVAALDTHGAAWADFDNDGDQDLIQLIDGGSVNQANQLLENRDGILINRAYYYGVREPGAHGRMPLWVDYNNDGWLDLLMTSSARNADPQTYNSLYRQRYDVFTKVDAEVGLPPTEYLSFAVLSDINFDGRMEILTAGGEFPETIYDTTQTPFAVLDTLAPLASVLDVALADFDGDTLMDIYAVHGLPPNELLQVDDYLVEAHVQSAPAVELGLDLGTVGDVTFDFAPDWQLRPATPVYLGAGASVLYNDDVSFALSPDDPAAQGLPDYAVGTDAGIFIGYDAATASWALRMIDVGFDVNLEIVATEPVTALSAVGFDMHAEPAAPDTLLRRAGDVFEDWSATAGVAEYSWGRAVAAGDFDNDMDVDVFILATGHTRNRANILYENLGDGRFEPVADAGGATGPVQGKGDAVAVADYNRDGYLDLFLTNGKSRAEWDQDGPVTLLRNAGGDNNWLEIDLRGVRANRDAIGAIVYVTAGGRTQIREQNGGFHSRAQNDQRLHFGLAANDIVDSVLVYWPNGNLQELAAVPVNQVLEIVEEVPPPEVVPCSGGLPKPGSGLPVLPAPIGDQQCTVNQPKPQPVAPVRGRR